MEIRNYSAIYRIMHWAIAVCMLLLLGTVIMRQTLFSRSHLAGIIQNYVTTKEIALSRDEIIGISRQISRPVWEWHFYFGYALAGLFFIRFVLPFFGQMKFVNPLKKQRTLKEKFQYWSYIVFTACAAVSLISGLLIKLGPRSLKDPMEEVHGLSLYYLLAFLIIHLGGVLWAELTNQKGLVSKIVSGTADQKS